MVSEVHSFQLWDLVKAGSEPQYLQCQLSTFSIMPYCTLEESNTLPAVLPSQSRKQRSQRGIKYWKMRWGLVNPCSFSTSKNPIPLPAVIQKQVLTLIIKGRVTYVTILSFHRIRKSGKGSRHWGRHRIKWKPTQGGGHINSLKGGREGLSFRDSFPLSWTSLTTLLDCSNFAVCV